MQRDFKSLITWSNQFNHLPWRQERSLYRTLVSEIMLQQTTVPTVLNKFEGFINKFPNIDKLANATEEEMLIAWKGLGYYRRAKNLLAAAKYIKENHNSNIPTEYNKLTVIPGIGDYTASALLSIGADQACLAIDTNLERVLSRYYDIEAVKGAELKKAIAQLLVEKKIFNTNISPRELNEAFMDLGREVCKTSSALCDSCPLFANCQSKDNPLIRPVVKKQQRNIYNLSLLRILVIENNNILAYKKNNQEWLAGQYECPTYILETGDSHNAQYSLIDFAHEHLVSYKTSITKYKITNYILEISENEFYEQFNWQRALIKLPVCHTSNLSTATQKALKKSRSGFGK